MVLSLFIFISFKLLPTSYFPHCAITSEKTIITQQLIFDNCSNILSININKLVYEHKLVGMKNLKAEASGYEYYSGFIK
jgi:hypothetical protein